MLTNTLKRGRIIGTGSVEWDGPLGGRWNHQEFFPGNRFVKNSYGNGRNLLRGEMCAHEIVNHPIHVENSLKAAFIFRISVRLSAKS